MHIYLKLELYCCSKSNRDNNEEYKEWYHVFNNDVFEC